MARNHLSLSSYNDTLFSSYKKKGAIVERKQGANYTATTDMKRFRLPHSLITELEQQPNMTAFVIAAIEEKLRRDARKRAKAKEA